MEIQKHECNGKKIAVISGTEKVLVDLQSALDLLVIARYEQNCDCIAISREAVVDEFFVLKTQLAGEILQKFVTYQTRLAIFGTFSDMKSRSLADFIRESNSGKSIFFADNLEQALNQLSQE